MKQIGKTLTKVVLLPDGTLVYSKVKAANWAIKKYGSPQAIEMYSKNLESKIKLRIVK